MRRRTVAAGLGLAITLAAPTALPPPAAATAPGGDGLIVFRADTGSGDNLYTLNPGGRRLTRITSFTGVGMDGPHWSPDGTRITVGVGQDGCPQVVTMRADGSDQVMLPLANGDLCEGSSTYSADGQQIYFEAYDGQNDALWRMRPDGTDRHQVTACQGQGVTDPEVSPDGRMLSMTCFSDTGQALFVSRIDGSDLRQLTPYEWNVGVKADWSPDSRHIMFISVGDAVNTLTIRPDGTGLTRVTDYPADGPRAYGNTYSPNGRWILMRLEVDGQYAMYTVHPDGTHLHQLTAFSSFRPRGMAWEPVASP